MSNQDNETVNHPVHYGGEDNPYEAIKVIEAMGDGTAFCRGNVIKYLTRAEHKGAEEADLLKALWYLKRYMSLKGIDLPADKPTRHIHLNTCVLQSEKGSPTVSLDDALNTLDLTIERAYIFIGADGIVTVRPCPAHEWH